MIEQRSERGVRYGYNPHEMRDIARSLLHVRAKADGFDGDCAEFWMGHTSRLDPLKYDKFYLDQGYMRQQYLIAAKHVNIISRPPVPGGEEQAERITQLEQELAGYKQALDEIRYELAGGEAGEKERRQFARGGSVTATIRKPLPKRHNAVNDGSATHVQSLIMAPHSKHRNHATRPSLNLPISSKNG